MAAWLWLVAIVMTPPALVVTGALRVQHRSHGHVVAHLAVRGRGLYFSRTPDGNWWKLRLRRRPCGQGDSWAIGDDDAPDSGVREPRNPSGPGPASTVRLELS